jgi:hypothetical protein
MPGQRAFKASKIAKPAPGLCPRRRRPGQIVSLVDGKLPKTPKEIGQKGEFIARKLSLLSPIGLAQAKRVANEQKRPKIAQT